jgi:hypothetical protein
MAQWQATLLVGALALLGNLGASMYYYGRLTERVHGHKGRLDEHKERLDRHDDILGEHGQRISALEIKKHS